jgi:ATP-independent RNA helicase DbpA
MRPSQAEMLQNLGIESLNDMQLASFGACTSGDDVMLLSPTGSGKTLGYLLPSIERLKPDSEHIQVLILSPARELALQIESVLRQLQTGYKVSCCYGGHHIKTELQSLSVAPSFLIGTPGRILDLLERGALDLSHLNTLVLDEFDKSLEMGFQEQMADILLHIPPKAQRVLTSATELEEIPEFVGLKTLQKLDFLAKGSSKLNIQQVLATEENDKFESLLLLMSKLGDVSMLVFLNHRESVEKLSESLARRGCVHTIFHGGLEQDDRERNLSKFRNGSSQILVCTDLAARGLDIPAVKAVIHYQIPHKEDAYTHRNGRTARMHATGEAYMLLSKEEYLPSYIGEPLPIAELPTEINLPPAPMWETIFVGRGKKDKINKVDILGFLCQKGGLDKTDIGMIEVRDFNAFVAVKRSKVSDMLRLVQDQKIKGSKAKIKRDA